MSDSVGSVASMSKELSEPGEENRTEDIETGERHE